MLPVGSSLGELSKSCNQYNTLVSNFFYIILVMYSEQDDIPDDFLCPVSQELMKDPVITSDGHTFDRSSIQNWLGKGKTTNPLTGAELPSKNLIPNITLRRMIFDFKQNSAKKSQLKKQESKSCLNLKKLSAFEKRNRIINYDKIRDMKKIMNIFKDQMVAWKIEFYQFKDEFEKKNIYEAEYQGDIVDGIPQGRGILIYKDGSRYEGCWKEGKRNGKGIFFYADGSRYEGQWTEGWIGDKGIIFYSNGNHYQGFFQNNKAEGFGTFSYQNGDVYEGFWENDKREGQEILLFADGRVYEGEWNDDLQSGYGKLTYPNDDKYEGHWKQGKRSGLGEMTLKEGENYLGEWLEDEFSGEGKLVQNTGECLEGQFRKSKLHGRVLRRHSDGKSFEEIWENGVKKN